MRIYVKCFELSVHKRAIYCAFPHANGQCPVVYLLKKISQNSSVVVSKLENDPLTSPSGTKLLLKLYNDNNLFFHHILAIDVFEISQEKISPICGFFWNFLALFDTFTTIFFTIIQTRNFLAVFILTNTLSKNHS